MKLTRSASRETLARLMKILLFILSVFIAHTTHSQSYTIEGIVWDTIYAGQYTSIQFDGIDCKNFYVKTEPGAYIQKDSCEFRILPYTYNVNYSIELSDSLGNQLKFDVFSASHDIEFLTLANDFLPEKINVISSQTAKQLRGIQVFAKCPWQRNACSILGYTFFISKKGSDKYFEETLGWQLGPLSKEKLLGVSSGDSLGFIDIRWKCPGDGQHTVTDRIFTIR